jgi:hypothetical protein
MGHLVGGLRHDPHRPEQIKPRDDGCDKASEAEARKKCPYRPACGDANDHACKADAQEQ